ncbi:endonuclease/exonuclease/phosphatase family protein [Ruficoccus sp. ZRK36]|uniref:endonuclease/exonuclease/phosphatase family protein n=1 Tax=Ruficoccus sp. ZRK36 TaxID=2866311 RepID=UPI001C72D184|nr:endonuclease/exonuclease/phosphatase family protein [Ruficoccus sp. ZRK36]QYY36599.1 endonuclease/exonuclease/phosphatase family protein [Ruficoccus sp. ZRK36]
MNRATQHSHGLISWRTLVTLLCAVLVLALGAFTLAGHFGEKDWRLDGLSHFRLEYFACLGLLGLFCLFTRRPILLVLTLVFLFWNGAEIFSVPDSPEPAPEARVYKAASFNIHTANREFDKILAWVREEDPDFFVIVEATNAMEPLYKELEKIYPQIKRRSMGRGGFGAMIYSHYPIIEERFGWAGVGTVPVRIELPEGPIMLVAMHPQAPVSKMAWGWRNGTLRDIATFCARQSDPVLLMGDMNCSPWSPFYKKFEHESGLSAPDVRWLPRRTWPAGLPFMWVPIDQFFVSKQIQPLAEWVGPEIGSDHYPIVMTFQVMRDRIGH